MAGQAPCRPTGIRRHGSLGATARRARAGQAPCRLTGIRRHGSLGATPPGARPVARRAARRGRAARRYGGAPPAGPGRPVGRRAVLRGRGTARGLGPRDPTGRDGTAVSPRGGWARRPGTGGAAGQELRGYGGRAALTGVGRHGPSRAHAGSGRRRGKFMEPDKDRRTRPAVRRRNSRVHCGPLTVRSTVDSAGLAPRCPPRRRGTERGCVQSTLHHVAARQTPGTTAEFRTAAPGDGRHTTLRRSQARRGELRPSGPAWPAPSGPARSSRPASGWPTDPAGSPSPRPCSRPGRRPRPRPRPSRRSP